MLGFSGNIKSEDVLLDKVFQCILPYTRKLSQIGENMIFVEKTFADC